MASIYLVTEGEYSDHSVIAAFTNEAAAETFAAAIRRAEGDTTDDYGAARVEDYPLFDSAPEVLTRLHLSFYLQRIADGAISDDPSYVREMVKTTTAVVDDFHGDMSVCKGSGPYAGSYGERETVRGSVAGIDHERVSKVYGELRAQALADFDILCAESRERDKALMDG